MGAGFSIGYINSTIILFLVTGALILKLDKKNYERQGMRKEMKAARSLGWINIALGCASIVAQLVIKRIM